MTKKQKIWAGVIIVVPILLYLFRKNISSAVEMIPSSERSKGLEPCYCKGVYRGLKRPNDCARMCEGLI